MQSKRVASLKPALFALAGLIIALVAGDLGVWATTDMRPGYQTVPTMPPTGMPRPTEPATEVPVPTTAPTGSPQPTPAPTGPAPGRPTASPPPAPASADLRVQFTVNRPHALAGEDIQYTIVVRNAGQAASGRLVVRDALPAALLPRRAHSSLGQASLSGQVVTVVLEALAAGESLTIQIEARIRPETPAGALIENRIELEHAGAIWQSEPIVAALPPAELPLVGGPGLSGP